jgi:hypothetical protein
MNPDDESIMFFWNAGKHLTQHHTYNWILSNSDRRTSNLAQFLLKENFMKSTACNYTKQSVHFLKKIKALLSNHIIFPFNTPA